MRRAVILLESLVQLLAEVLLTFGWVVVWAVPVFCLLLVAADVAVLVWKAAELHL